MIYREIKRSMIDMEKRFARLGENREIADAPGAKPSVHAGGTVRFEPVHCSCDRLEQKRQAELQSAARNKTALVAANRLSTAVHAHQILVMELGPHADLLALDGRYADMWQLQQSVAEAETEG